MKKILTYIIFLCCAFLAGINNISALSFADPMPYQIELEDGDKIFYMYICDTNDGDNIHACMCLKSGLYYSTDPKENIYFIAPYINDDININHSHYFYESQLVFSSDGKYFAVFGVSPLGLPEETRGTIAIAFYSNGRQFKKYTQADLVEADGTSFSFSPVGWHYERDFDPTKNIISVTTIEDTVYKFDITTGDIIDTIHSNTNISNTENIKSANNKFVFIIISIILICLLIVIFCIMKKIKTRKINRRTN